MADMQPHGDPPGPTEPTEPTSSGYNTFSVEDSGLPTSTRSARGTARDERRRIKAEARENKGSRGPSTWGKIIKIGVGIALANLAIGTVAALGYMGIKWAQSPSAEQDPDQTGGLSDENLNAEGLDADGLDASGLASVRAQANPLLSPRHQNFDVAPAPSGTDQAADWLLTQSAAWFQGQLPANSVSGVEAPPDRARALLNVWLDEDPTGTLRESFEREYGGPPDQPHPELANQAFGIEVDEVWVPTIAAGLAKGYVATGSAPVALDGSDALCAGPDRDEGVGATPVEDPFDASLWVNEAAADLNWVRGQLGLVPHDAEQVIETCEIVGGGLAPEYQPRNADGSPVPTTTPEPELEPSAMVTGPPDAEFSVTTRSWTEEAARYGAPPDLTPTEAATFVLMAKSSNTPAAQAVRAQDAQVTINAAGKVTDVRGIV